MIPDAPREDRGGLPTDVFFHDRGVSCETSPAEVDRVESPATAPASSSASPSATDLGSPAPATDLAPVRGASFAQLPVESITANARQPRSVFDEDELSELVGSIREIGVLQPIVVRRTSQTGDYELVMGERRLRAAIEAGLTHIPAIVRETADEAMLRDALLENLHRSQLNPLEEAAAYEQLLKDFGCTHEQLAQRLSRSRPQITNSVRLLRLPPLVARRVAAGVLSAGHARALLGLDDPAAMERLAQRIVAEGLSVRTVEELIALGETGRPVARTPRRQERAPELEHLATRLSDRWDTRVSINMGRKRGKLTVEFASVDDLNRILDAIGTSPDADAEDTASQDLPAAG